MAAKRYLIKYWSPSVAKAFPDGPVDLGDRREFVSKALENLNFLRNRATHHEPIFCRDLSKDIRNAIELLKAIDPQIANWVSGKLRLPKVIKSKPIVLRSNNT